jgi:hypothetical protein
MTLDINSSMKRITIGAVKVPKSIDHIQVGPNGAVSTPIRLISREKAASDAQSLGVKMLLLSTDFASALIVRKVPEVLYKLFLLLWISAVDICMLREAMFTILIAKLWG